MEEYWNQFLQWLGLVGQQQQQPRIAPRAEDRYANSYRHYPGDDVFDPMIPGTKHSVIQDTTWRYRPAWIMRNINDGDTVYTENPEQKRRISHQAVKRRASSKDKNRSEYNILKRRFNTAWKLAKEQEQ